MPHSETDICNQALALIGAGRIASINGQSKVERDCEAVYDQARDDVLASHHWTFARGRKQLQQVTDTPVFGFDYAYQLPVDYIRAMRLEDPQQEFAIEGNLLLCDLSKDVNLIYTKQVTDTTLFTTKFISLLSYRLAWPLAATVKRDQKLSSDMRDVYFSLAPVMENTDNNSDNNPTAEINPYVDSRGA